MPTSPFVVNIDVDDLSAATAFYTSAFGLRVGRRFPDPWIELVGGPAPIYLLEKAGGSPTPGSTRSYRRHWTPVHLDFVVADLDAAIERALTAGATLEQPIQDEPYGKLALLADPWGHGFCFLQFNTQGYDALALP